MKWCFSDGLLAFSEVGNPFSGAGLDGSVEIDGIPHSAAECTGDVRWSWDVREEDRALRITACLENTGGAVHRINHWNILRGGENALKFTCPGRDALIFRYFPWNIEVKNFTASDVIYTDSIALFTERNSGGSLLIAFETMDRMYCEHRIARADGGCAGYFAECFTGDYALAPGRKVVSEKLTIRFCADPYTALEEWAERINRHYRPEFSRASGVVFFSGWRDWFTTPECDPATETPKIAANVRKHFLPFGECMLYDSPHYTMKDGVPGNWLVCEDSLTGENFGDFFRRMHGEGWNFKTWFSPFWFFGEAGDALERNRENIQKDADGSPIRETVGSWEFARGKYSCAPLTKYFLDGTHPATREYLREVIGEKRKNGVRSYMLDFLYIHPGAVLHDDSLLPVQAARELLKVVREAAGMDTHLQTAVASSPIFTGCIDSARVVRDYGETRPLHPFPNWRNSAYCRHDEHFSNIHSFVQNVAGSYFTNGKLYMNDLNELLIDEPVPLNMAQINVTMFGLCGDSPVVCSDDLEIIAPERLRMMKMCFPRTGGFPKPADLFDRTGEEGGCRILVKKIRTDYEEYTLAAVFNTAPGAGGFSEDIALERLGCDPRGKYRIHEFWNNEYVGTFRGAFPCALHQDQCKLFRISEARNHPWLLSTDMHVEQGRCEVRDLRFDEDRLILSGTACRPAGESGRLYFILPWNYRLQDTRRINTMKEVIDMQTVACMYIEFTRDEERFELRFARDESEYVARPGWLPYATEAEWRAYVAANRDKYHPCRVIE